MPKANGAKRKSEIEEGGPKTKRQRATAIHKSSKRKGGKSNKAPDACAQPASQAVKPTLHDLPDNVLANIFTALGIDRLRAMQGK